MKTTVSGCYDDNDEVHRCGDENAEFWSVYTCIEGESEMWHSDHETRASAEYESTKLGFKEAHLDLVGR